MEVNYLIGKLRELAGSTNTSHCDRLMLIDATLRIEHAVAFSKSITQALALDEGYNLDGIVSQVRETHQRAIRNGNLLQSIGAILGVPGGHQHENLPNALRELMEEMKGLKASNEGMEATLNGIIEATGGDWQDVDDLPKEVAKLIDARDLREAQGETPAKSAFSEEWLSDVIDLLRAVAGDLSPDNRLMSIVARHLILSAPRLDANEADGVWHDWHGGECPVDPDDRVEVKYRDGTSSNVVDAS